LFVLFQWCNPDLVRFQVLTVASLKMWAFWDLVLCSIGVDWCFRGAHSLHHQVIALMMEAVCTCESWLYFNETTWCYIPEGSHFQTLDIIWSLGYFLENVGHAGLFLCSSLASSG
jgi:hypothetical protein